MEVILLCPKYHVGKDLYGAIPQHVGFQPKEHHGFEHQLYRKMFYSVDHELSACLVMMMASVRLPFLWQQQANKNCIKGGELNMYQR
eukprot:15365938-Ditylum_brightwellii.AAC.1